MTRAIDPHPITDDERQEIIARVIATTGPNKSGSDADTPLKVLGVAKPRWKWFIGSARELEAALEAAGLRIVRQPGFGVDE